jgi:hypothetical protein
VVEWKLQSAFPSAPLGAEVATPKQERAMRRVEPATLTGIRVLVVEDHDDNAALR